MVVIHLFLFGKPEWEFTKGKLNPKKLKSKGDELKSRMYEIADSLQKLSAKNWEYDFAGYDILLTKDISKTAAEKELVQLGLTDIEIEEDYNE